ncbi:hypothetical protein DFH29DRAFT_899034 [Suillus ampliporus]|nr:hypothetical protein DFH29DRAFT_899019 [Suillus ampliporus]KAG0706916.1 hypothetical protein DFH29DRAFT_899034 [Suillus ampliporus]
MFLVGSVWFAVWSLATAFVPSSTIFIVDIALLGMGSAAKLPVAIFPMNNSSNPGGGFLTESCARIALFVLHPS